MEVLIYDEVLRVERADHWLVSYPCVYNTRQRRITAVDAHGRQQYHHVQAMQLLSGHQSSCTRSGGCRTFFVCQGIEEGIQLDKWASSSTLQNKPFKSV